MPFSWEVGPADAPADLGERLMARGLLPDPGGHPGHGGVTDRRFSTWNRRQKRRSTIVRDPSAFDEWLGAFRDAFGMPADLVDVFWSLRLLGFGDDLSYRLVLARVRRPPGRHGGRAGGSERAA